MTKHIHADAMLRYARDAAETDKPWERWECAEKHAPNAWCNCRKHPLWCASCHYRRKPQTIKISGFEFPAPEMVAPVQDIDYWVVFLHCNDRVLRRYWTGDDADYRYLQRRILHLSKDAALQHARVLDAISCGKSSLEAE